MRTARRQLLHAMLVTGALILTTATPTLARSGPAPTIQSQTKASSPSLALRLLIFLGVVVDDGVPF
jgi:hypothetical protein